MWSPRFRHPKFSTVWLVSLGNYTNTYDTKPRLPKPASCCCGSRGKCVTVVTVVVSSTITPIFWRTLEFLQKGGHHEDMAFHPLYISALGWNPHRRRALFDVNLPLPRSTCIPFRAKLFVKNWHGVETLLLEALTVLVRLQWSKVTVDRGKWAMKHHENTYLDH